MELNAMVLYELATIDETVNLCYRSSYVDFT